MIRLELSGQVRGGKNHINITRTGKRYPTAEWAAWRDKMVWQVRSQVKGPKPIFSKPCNALIRYWAGDKKRRDVPAILDSLFHVLEKSGIVKDDVLLDCITFHTDYDKEHPRVFIEIEER